MIIYMHRDDQHSNHRSARFQIRPNSVSSIVFHLYIAWSCLKIFIPKMWNESLKYFNKDNFWRSWAINELLMR